MPIPLPGQSEETPPQTFVVEKFGTLNTKANRPSIKNEEFFYCDGWFPIGDGNLRTLYAEGANLYTASGKTIIFNYPYNIGATSYIAVFLSDGSAIQVRNSDGAITTIGPAGAFWSSGDFPACAQWQSIYLLIISTKTANSYWIWDGSTLFGSGGLSPQVTVTNAGSGYTSAPTVTAYGGSGSGATFVATVANGSVTGVKVTNPGTGYIPGDLVQLGFSGGGSDTQAIGTASISTSTGGVSAVNVTAGGSAYTTSTIVSFSGGGGSGATGLPLATNGVITGVQVTNPGSGYTSPPTVSITDTGGGTGATADSVIETGQVSSIAVTVAGSGYVGNPTVTIIGDGTGATAVANITAGAVSGFTVTNAGLGYTLATVQITGGNRSAAAAVTLMAVGVSGTTLETYQSRVWTANGTSVQFTAPASPTDFATSDGGGSYSATDSFLRDKIVRLAQANGFLYQFGDSSINVISNVQTTGNPPTTTFNNSNVDPQVGTAWRDSVVAFGRALVFANPTGVYALYGGAAEKVSSPLDGMFGAASFNTGGSGVIPTAAVATLFSIRCYIFLFTTFDTLQQVTRTMMACWDGQKWFTASQLKTPIFLSTQEINSELSAWASDGVHLYEMFQTPSTALAKTWQNKLLSLPSGYLAFKQINRLYVMAENTTTVGGDPVQISIDTERGSGIPTISTVGADQVIFVGVGAITFVGTGPITFVTNALSLYGYGTSSYGRLFGLTMATNAADLTLLSITLLYNDYASYA